MHLFKQGAREGFRPDCWFLERLQLGRFGVENVLTGDVESQLTGEDKALGLRRLALREMRVTEK